MKGYFPPPPERLLPPPGLNCDSCGEPFNGQRPHLDHDHGMPCFNFRGWVHLKCNLCQFNDDPEKLVQRVAFLRRTKAENLRKWTPERVTELKEIDRQLTLAGK